MKLSVRIPLLIGAVVLITSFFIIFITEMIVTREMETSTYNEMSSNAAADAELLKTKMDALLSQLWEIANRARTRTMDWEGVVRANLVPDVSRIDSLDLGLVRPDGSVYYVNNQSADNMGGQDFIKQAFTGKSTVSDLIFGSGADMPKIILAAPVLLNDEKNSPVQGVLVADKDGSTFLENLVSEIKLSQKTSFGFLIDSQGTYTAYPDINMVLNRFNPIQQAQKDPSYKSLGDMIAMAIQDKEGYTNYVIDGKKMICAFAEIPGYPWTLVLVVERNVALASTDNMRLIMLLIGIICAVIGITIAVFMGRSIAKPVVSMAVTMKDVGKGDLTKRISLNSKDEIGELSSNINSTLDNIKNLIILIKKESETLSGIGSVLAKNSTNAASSVSVIADAIQTVNSKVVNQSASVTETNATMEQISINIDKLNGHIREQSLSVSQSSSAIEQMLANIQSITQTLIKNSANVKDLMYSSEIGRTGLQDVAADIQEIAHESEGLLEINSVMENIASQTNLLSMNAAIEAAHAGEAGRGFSVVADEIRKLAENSSEQSKIISAVLQKIKGSIDKITVSTGNVLDKFTAIDSGVKIVSEQEENIRNAVEEQGEGSKQILEAVSRLNEITRQVSEGSRQMLEGSREIISEGRNLEITTQEITGGMSDMAKNADQISTAANEVNTISGQNKEIIDNLVIAVSQFKVAQEKQKEGL